MKKWEPYISVRAVQPVVTALGILGYDVADILQAVNISPALLRDADGKIPHGAIMRLWDYAQRVTGDDHLGIHLAEAAPIRSFEVHSYALLASPTLRDAYCRACRYQRLIHEATNLTFEERPDGGILQHALPDGRSVPRHPAEFLVTLWVRFGRLVAGQDWIPRLICFAHPAPDDTSEHTRVFRSQIRFSSGRTAMYIPDEILDIHNPRVDENLLTLLDRYAEGLLKKLPQTASTAERLRLWLHQVLSDGVPTTAEAARALNLSVRTLHRRLRDEGTSFRELLDQLRKERAVALLADQRCSIAEVGFLLGFAELSSFSRSFKRWTGKSPAAFRKQSLGASSLHHFLDDPA
ncbi:AraC family transcriptional regulator [Candidatus Parcubacteria bacterium]|nr:MAG: AraC family transcriptional regulator [Candidatus Parcubacteria bacterium]